MLDAVKAKIEKPVYHSADQDCGGQWRDGYWTASLFCSDGGLVGGVGASEQEAVANAMHAQAVRERFLNAPARQRIMELLQSGCRGTREQEDFNKAVAHLLGIG